MTPELEQQLLKDFPHLYQDLYKSPMQTCMAFGIECDDGWYDLIRELSEKINPLVLALPEEERIHCKLAQVKEKFGSTRIYLSGGTDEMYDLIHEYEVRSKTICEICGQPGKTRGKSWYKTLCDQHAIDYRG